MEKTKYILSLDVGTTGVRASVYDHDAQKVVQVYRRLEADVDGGRERLETDANMVYDESVAVMREAIQKASLSPTQIASIGITVQRNAFTSWDKQSGKALHPFISWADLRSTEICDTSNNSLATRGLRKLCYLLYLITGAPKFLTFRNFTWKTSVLGPKLCWVWANLPQLRQVHAQGNLLVGTMESWIAWKLTGGRCHAMDCSNASSTAIYDSYEMQWSGLMKALLHPAQLPPWDVLPKVTDTMADFGVIDKDILGAEIPICAMAADQQAALCGECCFEPGEAKVTLGTGCFVTINTGKAMASYGGLYPLIAWKGANKPPVYAMEGLEHTAGIAVDWMQTLGLVDHVEQTALAASSVSNAGGVYFVPAFYGLGTPYWDSHARGCFIGMTASTNRNHLIRAALESLAFRIAEIVQLMRTDLKTIPHLKTIRVDGGVSRNDFVCQAIADLGNIEVTRYEDHDATSLGAAFFAGVQCGFWKDLEEIKALRKVDKVFTPQITEEERSRKVAEFRKAAERSTNWDHPTKARVPTLHRALLAIGAVTLAAVSVGAVLIRLGLLRVTVEGFWN